MTHLPHLQENLWISAVPSVHASELSSEAQKIEHNTQRTEKQSKPPKKHKQKRDNAEKDRSEKELYT